MSITFAKTVHRTNPSLLAEGSPRPEPLVFKKQRGNAYEDDYEDEYGLWKHEHPIMAEGPIWLYIMTYEWPSERFEKPRHRWASDLIAVSPFFATDTSIISAMNSMGDYLEESWDGLNDAGKEAAICEMLIDYGVKLTVITKTSTRAKGPFKGCAVEASVASFLWGFVADRQVNAIGSSGWDFLSGDLGLGEHKKTPDGFQVKVIDWLNNRYPDRKEHHT